jgi:hypothetical protein
VDPYNALKLFNVPCVIVVTSYESVSIKNSAKTYRYLPRLLELLACEKEILQLDHGLEHWEFQVFTSVQRNSGSC